MKIPWSTWVPWLRRKHPLGEPVRPFRVTGYPDVPRVVGKAGQDQVFPEVPQLIYPGGFLRSVRLEIGPLTGCSCPDDEPVNDAPFGPIVSDERESRP